MFFFKMLTEIIKISTPKIILEDQGGPSKGKHATVLSASLFNDNLVELP